MTEWKRSKVELNHLANDILFVRNEINEDNLNSLFSDVTLIQYNLLKHIWPELPTCTECPKSKITLRALQAESELPMNRISQIVERLHNAGLVLWERGESGTYIILTDHGFERYKKQEQMLLSYLDNVVDIMGIDRFEEIIADMRELESVLNQVANTNKEPEHEDSVVS